MDLFDELQTRILTGDGAMGSYLMELGIPLTRCFEELTVSEPDLVRRVHEEYIAAGARVIETNTFGGNAVRLARHGMEDCVNEINWSAAQLAKDAAKGRGVYVAGSVGPLGIDAEQARTRGIDREAVFREQIGALLDGGVNLIFFETFLDFEEMALALYVKQSLHHAPAICSFACTAEGRLSDGTELQTALAKVRELGADVAGVNCANGPHAMLRLLERIAPGEPLAAFPNAGYPRYHEGRFIYNTSPEYFAETGIEMVRRGATLVGGCCGTNPTHIAALAEALKAAAPVTVSVAPTPQSAPPLPEPAAAAPAAETIILDLLAQGRTVIVTELDPPKTLELEKFYAGAQALQQAGSDCITLADNSLAILRVSNLAVAAVLKQRFGITPLVHLSCRDRNLLALQSDLMGMAALGMRHVLPLTGDPAKTGDHPGAASVYDVTSIELLKIIEKLNAGFCENGRTIKRGADLVPGCTFNPNARNLDAQLARLERKLSAGAKYILTQPVFDTALVEETARRLAQYQVPAFIGVWPLLNGRQAEFLHHEVPGILIPDGIREQMRGLEGASGRAKGLDIAKQVARAVLDHFPGIYLITPFLTYETTAELAAFVRAR